jgi:hypothetical protein
VLDPMASTDCAAWYRADSDVMVMADTTAGFLVPLTGAPNGPVGAYASDISGLGAPTFER